MTDSPDDARWSSAWPDLLAFAAGLAAAWWGHWNAGDLVWSLWLSSLVVGWVMLLWGIVRPFTDFAGAASRDASFSRTIGENSSAAMALGGVALVFGIFKLAFFTVHFGGFHYVHSMILGYLFPIHVGDAAQAAEGRAMYMEIARRYWVFLPSAFLAERAVFMRRPPRPETDPSVTASAIAARKRANANRPPDAMSEPYRKVMRMHALIFFFGAAHFAGLENFAVYAVVYAVYFFPWRLVRSRASVTAPAV